MGPDKQLKMTSSTNSDLVNLSFVNLFCPGSSIAKVSIIVALYTRLSLGRAEESESQRLSLQEAFNFSHRRRPLVRKLLSLNVVCCLSNMLLMHVMDEGSDRSTTAGSPRQGVYLIYEPWSTQCKRGRVGRSGRCSSTAWYCAQALRVILSSSSLLVRNFERTTKLSCPVTSIRNQARTNYGSLSLHEGGRLASRNQLQ